MHTPSVCSCTFSMPEAGSFVVTDDAMTSRVQVRALKSHEAGLGGFVSALKTWSSIQQEPAGRTGLTCSLSRLLKHDEQSSCGAED